MVGKMVIIFDNYALVGEITVVIISFDKGTLVGSQTEIIFTSFNKTLWSVKWKQLLSDSTQFLWSVNCRNYYGSNGNKPISCCNISTVDKMKIIFISSYKDTLARSKI